MSANPSASLDAEALTLRPATPDDLPLLIELYAAMDGEAPLALGAVEAVFQQIQAIPHAQIYLAALGPDVVGTFTLLLAPTMMHRGIHRFALLDAVTVLPQFRGQGMGKAMVVAALHLAQEAGCYKLMLSSNLQRDRAHAFYRSLGFEQHGWSFSLTIF